MITYCINLSAVPGALDPDDLGAGADLGAALGVLVSVGALVDISGKKRSPIARTRFE